MGVVQHRDRCEGIRAVHFGVWIEFGFTSFTKKPYLSFDKMISILFF